MLKCYYLTHHSWNDWLEKSRVFSLYIHHHSKLYISVPISKLNMFVFGKKLFYFAHCRIFGWMQLNQHFSVTIQNYKIVPTTDRSHSKIYYLRGLSGPLFRQLDTDVLGLWLDSRIACAHLEICFFDLCLWCCWFIGIDWCLGPDDMDSILVWDFRVDLVITIGKLDTYICALSN